MYVEKRWFRINFVSIKQWYVIFSCKLTLICRRKFSSAKRSFQFHFCSNKKCQRKGKFEKSVVGTVAREFPSPKNIRDAGRVNLREIVAGNFPIKFRLEKRPFRIIFGPIKGGVLRTAL